MKLDLPPLGWWGRWGAPSACILCLAPVVAWSAAFGQWPLARDDRSAASQPLAARLPVARPHPPDPPLALRLAANGTLTAAGRTVDLASPDAPAALATFLLQYRQNHLDRTRAEPQLALTPEPGTPARWIGLATYAAAQAGIPVIFLR